MFVKRQRWLPILIPVAVLLAGYGGFTGNVVLIAVGILLVPAIFAWSFPRRSS